MSDEVKIGDRWKSLDYGNVWEAVSIGKKGPGHWDFKCVEGAYKGQVVDCKLSHMEQGYERLPRTPSLEDRRRGLKRGDRITEPELLAVDMRVKVERPELVSLPKRIEEFTVARFEQRDDGQRWWHEADGWVINDVAVRAGLVFLGWATEEKGESETITLASNVVIGRAADAIAPGTPLAFRDGLITDAKTYQPGPAEMYWRGARALFSDPRAIIGVDWGVEPPPQNTQKRHPDCKASHEPRTGCAPCERLIAAEMASQDTDSAHGRALSQPAGRTRYEPRCGDFVGRVMTPVVRR